MRAGSTTLWPLSRCAPSHDALGAHRKPRPPMACPSRSGLLPSRQGPAPLSRPPAESPCSEPALAGSFRRRLHDYPKRDVCKHLSSQGPWQKDVGDLNPSAGAFPFGDDDSLPGTSGPIFINRLRPFHWPLPSAPLNELARPSCAVQARKDLRTFDSAPPAKAAP